MVCNRGSNPEYGIDYSIWDTLAAKYVLLKRDIFNLEVGQCRTITTVVPLDMLPSVWAPKYFRGCGSIATTVVNLISSI